ncbi:MAG: alpha/beta hydrolase [Gammaproteobacteria bacterium]
MSSVVSGGSALVSVPVGAKALQVEYQWVGEAREKGPVIVFLHEGLGSLSMWRTFPDQLARACGMQGLVYSRPGYGQSTPRGQGEKWAPTFMHEQAIDVLPAFLSAVGLDPIRRPLVLMGHSDGGSIALLFSALTDWPCRGIIVMAPHLFVEDVSIRSIRQAREVYLKTDMREKLGRYHADPDSAFWGWNDVWLSPAFASWNIEDEVCAITAPILAMQGVDDEYGTLEQIRRIHSLSPRVELAEISDCRHSPHRDQPERVIALCQQFLTSLDLGS